MDNEEFEDEETARIMGELEDAGIMNLSGVDENGEVTYTFDMDRLKDEMPELYNLMLADLNEELLSLYNKGLVEIEYDENLEPTFYISDEGIEIMRKNGIDFND